MNNAKIIMEKYFEEHSFVGSNIDSFNKFIEKELQNIIDENQEIEPTIIPQNVDEYKIKFGKIRVEEP